MKRVHHLAATVQDLDQTLAFYCDVLGATIEWPEGPVQEGPQTDTIFGIPGCRVRVAGINLHGTIIEFFEFLSPPSKEYEKLKDHYRSLGWMHVAIEVDDIDEQVRRLSDKGVEFLYPVQKLPHGDKMVYFLDPNGIMLELIQRAR